MSVSATSEDRLGSLVRRGLVWSAASNLTLRFGTVAVGIALARLLSPEDFGVYAVALTVQAVLMSFADLGLSAGLIVSDDPDREASTAGGLGLAAGCLSALGMFLVAEPLAMLLGSPDSAPAIRWLALTLALAGAGIVPYAMLQRRFAQREIFFIAVADFVVSTTVTLGLILAGWGVIAIAIGRVVAQSLVLVLQYRAAGVRPRFALDRVMVGPVVRFGLPVAGTTLLSLLVLNIDNVVVVRVAGPVELGFYVLAFNVASWPMSALGQVVRSVSLPAFARSRDVADDGGAVRAISLAWGFALPAGACLAVLAAPLVVSVYGDRWQPAVPLLVALGIFGALRVLFDVVAAFLLAHGRSALVLWIQIAWCAALIPTLVLATRAGGAVGASWSHLLVGCLVVVPAYALALSREGLSVRSLALGMLRPTLCVVPAGVAGALVVRSVDSPWLALLGGALAGAVVYAALAGRWLRRLASDGPAVAPTTAATPVVV